MGRELRRKQAKKDGKSLQREETFADKNEIGKLFRIIGLLVFIICAIYLLSALFVTKELDWFSKEDDKESAALVKNTILATEIFNQVEEEYYVYMYDYKDEDSQVTSSVNSKLGSKKVYKVDMGSGLNNKYVSDVGNRDAKTLSELKVKAPTVIKITGDVISAYYEGNEIISNLK